MKKILLIGASGGIGNTVAQNLLDNGYEVVGTYFRHPEMVKNLQVNRSFKSRYLDLSEVDSIKKVCKEIKTIYAIVNCAGVVDFEGESLEKDIEIWNNTISVNLTGNYLLAKVLRDKIEKFGSFIMISSTDAKYGGTITTSYAASKSGVNSLTKSLSLLLSNKKVRVNTVAPGWVVTPMIEKNGDKFLEEVAKINPLKRNAIPLDVAKLVTFLISENANYVNGQIINLEGGYTNQDPTLIIEETIQNE